MIDDKNLWKILSKLSYKKDKHYKKYKCPCCGFYTFKRKPTGSYDICPVCFWEDDLFQSLDPDCIGIGANKVSLNQGKANFIEFGACEREMIPNVRAPLKSEMSGID